MRLLKRLGIGCGVAAFGLAGMASSAQGAFVINLTFVSGITPSQQAVFTQAKTFWEGIILDYKPGVPLTGPSISAKARAMDGEGGKLGSAGPDTGDDYQGTAYVLTGSMEFDSADISRLETNNSLLEVIKHEMAHVLGFGTLWWNNDLYVQGSGQFTGINALAAYRAEFNQPLATYVPVEMGGGIGTAGAHWNEVDNGAGNTGIKDLQGRDMKNELMTGWLNTPTFLSNTTIQSFADLGYVVIPEPASMSMVMLVGAGALLRRRRGG